MFLPILYASTSKKIWLISRPEFDNHQPSSRWLQIWAKANNHRRRETGNKLTSLPTRRRPVRHREGAQLVVQSGAYKATGARPLCVCIRPLAAPPAVSARTPGHEKECVGVVGVERFFFFCADNRSKNEIRTATWHCWALWFWIWKESGNRVSFLFAWNLPS
jgi:hypothetical protein